jgi:glyoxylase I family protein
MKLEHFALNVSDPIAMAAWYQAHLGMIVVRKIDEAPFGHFLADDSGTIMFEIYNNPPSQVPAYARMNPLLLHIAFISDDPEADLARLTAAGATFADDVHPPDGSRIITLRDPWGLAIQLCRRAKPMLRQPTA